ncbi:MAG: hypothetical protein RQ875_14575 [Vicingaceae bacterium]|nr:hypothetical protein [Vicingaceae bacterium]
MNYLLEQSIKRHGKVIFNYQHGNIQKQVYSYQDKQYSFDSYKPIPKPNFIEKEKGAYKMKTLSKLAQLKAKKQANQVKLETATKPAIKHEMTLQGLAEVKALKQEIDAIKSLILATNEMIKHQGKQIEKLYQISFNNNNDQIISLLTSITELLKNKTPETKQETPETKQTIIQPETKQENNQPDNTYEIFRKYFPGNVSEDNFNLAFRKADFSNIESMEESLKVIEKQNQNEGKGFLCARKSKKSFISAMWQTYNDCKGGKTETRVIDKSNSPVFSLKGFSKSLGIKMETVNEILEYIDSLDCFGDDEENEIYGIILEENPELEDEESIEEFIEFCRNKF